MRPIYRLLRYLASLLPSRCLQILLRLWRRLAIMLGLSSSPNQCPVRPELPLGTTHVISASHVPGDRILLADVSLGSSSGNKLGLDISDMTRRQSTSATEWPFSGDTIVSSPIAISPGSPKKPSLFRDTEDSANRSFAATVPSRSRRYDDRSP